MFLIAWSDEAFESIHRLVLQYPGRRTDFAASLKQADRMLSTDPIGSSESREGRYRICIVSPLTLFFTVDFEDDTVEITDVIFNLRF